MAEIVVQEWLNRNGYFTIRGIRVGNGEVDLLAVKIHSDGNIERRHVEVQASSNPIGYLVTGNARRLSATELDLATRAWVTKKFNNQPKQALFHDIAGGPWSRELVYHKLCHEPEESDALIRNGVQITLLLQVVADLKSHDTPIRKAGGSDLIELMSLLD
ncbi:MAG TPA: hypothetical protein PLL77_03340 [Pyrinomonadaceae bacterium]|nr:hypothetical protein [Pyrinomonadaceae bacterium]